MDNRYKVDKTKCEICGRTVKKILLKNKEYNNNDFFKTQDGNYICKQCEREYRVIDNYSERGYGYKYNTNPKTTAMDTISTPTFGVEIEVAGNLKNIGKIEKLTYPTSECSIGYDTSVEGAQFELSYAPGTYYWYLHESKLQAVCNLIKKDKWAKDSETIGTHIHVGNIDAKYIIKCIQIESIINSWFWKILKAVGERDFNKYCENSFTGDHHDAISYSHRWRTLEFRFFKGTYDFKTIMDRMRFLRQLIENTTRDGVNWFNFKKEIKDWTINKIEQSELLNTEEKTMAKSFFTEKDAHKNKIEEELKNTIMNNDEQYEEESDW